MSKHPNYDYTDCFVLALPQSSPTFAYREAYAPLLCSNWGVSQGHAPTIVQAQVGPRPFDTVILFINFFAEVYFEKQE